MIRTKKLILSQYVPENDAPLSVKWLCTIFNRAGLNTVSLARKLHISKQQVSNYGSGKSKMSFPIVCAICYVTGLDDPEDVWNQIKED